MYEKVKIKEKNKIFFVCIMELVIPIPAVMHNIYALVMPAGTGMTMLGQECGLIAE
jgi:hypothetical protein